MILRYMTSWPRCRVIWALCYGRHQKIVAACPGLPTPACRMVRKHQTFGPGRTTRSTCSERVYIIVRNPSRAELFVVARAVQADKSGRTEACNCRTFSSVMGRDCAAFSREGRFPGVLSRKLTSGFLESNQFFRAKRQRGNGAAGVHGSWC